MNLTDTFRSIATLAISPIPAIKVRSWSLRLGATSFFLAGALVLTATRIDATRRGYELNETHRQRQLLEADVGRLEVELANLARPQRISELARRMGLSDPRSDQIIVMDD